MGEGEFDLIARLVERLPSTGEGLRIGSGDDAAVVDPGGRATATTVDAVVEGVHFTLPEFPLEAVGRKALAAALSDLAAMGAEPGEAYVTLAAPGELGSDALVAVADGVAAVAEREGVAIAGGDFTRGPALILAITCVGYEGSTPLVARAGAGDGEVLAVTGELGGAATAVELLAAADAGDGQDANLSEADRDRLLARQLDPRPRLAAGRALAASGATAMIDVSDGLGADAGHLADASGVRLEIEFGRVPAAPGLAAALGGADGAERAVASGGEDFELLATLPAERFDAARDAVAEAGTVLTQIGAARPGNGVALRRSDGSEVEAAGFDHRRGSRAGSA
ncbi:MAG: thiamine-phosphate kinase [Solirubrobacterales bacterium]